MVTSKAMHRPKETLLPKYLGASLALKFIDFFLDNPLSDCSKNEIVRDIGTSRVTFFKFWKELEKPGAVRPTRKTCRPRCSA